MSPQREPPRHIWYGLVEALDLLSALDDARDSLVAAGQLAAVVAIESELQTLNRTLDLDEQP